MIGNGITLSLANLDLTRFTKKRQIDDIAIRSRIVMIDNKLLVADADQLVFHKFCNIDNKLERQ